jgi:hypothetical protein
MAMSIDEQAAVLAPTASRSACLASSDGDPAAARRRQRDPGESSVPDTFQPYAAAARDATASLITSSLRRC